MDALTLVLWAFVIAVAIFDLRSQIIPDSLNIAGAVLGFGLMWWLRGDYLWPLAGAAIGALCLTLLGLLGKRLFGRRAHSFAPEPFAIELLEGQLVVRSGDGHTDPWADFFTSRGDRVELDCTTWSHGQDHGETDVLVCSRDRCQSTQTGKTFLLSSGTLAGTWHGVRHRAEVLGWGDVKMAAALGTFFGLQTSAVLALACAIGAIAGVPLRRLGVREFPFGPFLGSAALVWWHYGAGLWAWYLARFWQ